MKTSILGVMAVAALFFAGCAHHGYGTGDGVNFVDPETASLTDLTRMTAQMADKLHASPAFRVKYDEVRAELGGGKLPALQIGNFENLVATSSGRENIRQYTPKLETCRAKARECFQESGLFRIVDDTASFGSNADELNKSLAADIDKGLADPRNLQYAAGYTPADFRMTGTLKRMRDGDSSYFVFEIRLIDLRTREFWTSTEIMEKF